MGDVQAATTQLLDLAADHLLSLPPALITSGLILFVVTTADDVRDKYMLHYWLTFTGGFGGGLTSALLLMRPDDVPINLLVQNTDILFTVFWWLANYFPYNIPGRILRTTLVTEICKLLLIVAVGKVMCSRLDSTVQFYPGATIGAIFVGCLGGCGGKIINDVIRGGYHMAKEPDEMRLPGIGANRAVLCCTLYYALVHVYHILTSRQGTALVVMLLMIHTLLIDLTGVNILRPLVAGLHTVFNVPQPVPPAPRPTVKPSRPSTSGETKKNS